MGAVRAKFQVQSVTRRKNWDKAKGDLFDVKLGVVTATNPENSKFYAATPSGEIVLSTINEAAANALPLGGEVYVDFMPVEEAVTSVG